MHYCIQRLSSVTQRATSQVTQCRHAARARSGHLGDRSPHPSASQSGRGRHLSPVVDRAGSAGAAASADKPPRADRPWRISLRRYAKSAGSRGQGFWRWNGRATADVIGYCGLTIHGNGSPDEPELAYELLRAVHGCGYATEAGRAVVTWASEADYRRLWAGVWDWNVASRRVLEKLGFREAGRVEPDSVYGHSLLTVRDF